MRRGEEMSSISRVLVANRGEIAVRIIRACKALGIGTVVTVSEADRDSMASRLADRAVCIGPPRPSESYLNVGAIVTAAQGTGCDAIHPGYGFLAEQPRLANACRGNGIVFIGPDGNTIEQMGNKILARTIAEKVGVPIVPGSDKVRGYDEALDVARRIGFPLLLKAAAGGGGRGMRIVTEEGGLKSAFESASGEAGAAFGDDTVYIERYIRNARHIEVQVIGDKHGNVVHLGERDCSSQRRYQKIVEEAPAPDLDKLRPLIHEAALKLARATHYENAGTIEFIVDQDAGTFYFLEMNTRIQVEHPVTEMITGIDLVQEQIRVASGQPLGFRQDDIRISGHAIECRVNAEAADQGFRPSPGRIRAWNVPEGAGIRVDSHCYPGYLVPPYYDSMLAKVIVHAEDRAAAIARMEKSLADIGVEGIQTTIPFLKTVITQPEFREGKTHVRWIEAFLSRAPPAAV
jgi:acetyl-CoA carboxylase biotin carboxylase subunit